MKILLLCEAPMCINAGGISQTLYNIFSFVNTQDILCIAPVNDIRDYPPSAPFENRYLGYRFDFIRLPANRFTQYMGPIIQWLNNSINQNRRFGTLKRAITAFEPDVVVSCPNGVKGIILHHKLLGNSYIPVIPYFMDDWMYQSKLRWLGGSLHGSIKKMLATCQSWMMISNELGNVLKERYQVDHESLLVVHNPVNITDAPIPALNKKEVIRLAYAGALWPMHMDALEVVAKAIHILHNEMPVELVVYTGEQFWNWRKQSLEPLGVIYGGNIPYHQIHKKLSEANALILVSSFAKELYTHAKASVQTKITDYLKSRQLIISCGPDYSANHSFLKKHDCGICIETNDVEAVTVQLREVLLHPESYNNKISNGWRVLEKEFAIPVVHGKVKQYLQTVSAN